MSQPSNTDVPLLAVNGVEFAYGVDPVLRGISFSLRAGQMLALVGPNGAGKSTLIRVLLGQLRGRGRVEWEAKPVENWSRRELARAVAYLPQSPAFEPGQTVADVLRLGRAPHGSAFGIESPRDNEVLARVAAALQLNDLLPRAVDDLSGGQRQRVFIGRCLAQQPRALLLDEPSSFLDLRHQLDLYRLLRDLASKQNMGILMASHELNLAGSFSDGLILLDAGRIAAAATPSQVLRPEVLGPVYDVELETFVRPGRPPLVFPKM
jgi:iron complex transport system ATP-binding protein